MPFDAADLAAFVDPTMPGYVSATINGQSIAGLFRAKYAEAFGLVGGNQPMLRCLDTLVAVQGDPVVIGADAYTVASIEPQGQGMTVLMLEAA